MLPSLERDPLSPVAPLFLPPLLLFLGFLPPFIANSVARTKKKNKRKGKMRRNHASVTSRNGTFYRSGIKRSIVRAIIINFGFYAFREQGWIETREMSFKSIYRSREWLYDIAIRFPLQLAPFLRKIFYEENRSDGGYELIEYDYNISVAKWDQTSLNKLNIYTFDGLASHPPRARNIKKKDK